MLIDLVFMGGVFIMGALCGLSSKKNSRWSTADFVPLLFWVFAGFIFGIVLDLLLENIFGVDGKSIPIAIGLMVAGCGIFWYRTRSQR